MDNGKGICLGVEMSKGASKDKGRGKGRGKIDGKGKENEGEGRRKDEVARTGGAKKGNEQADGMLPLPRAGPRVGQDAAVVAACRGGGPPQYPAHVKLFPTGSPAAVSAAPS